MVFARTFNLYDELAEVAPNGVIRPQVFVKARSMDRCMYAYDICTMYDICSECVIMEMRRPWSASTR